MDSFKEKDFFFYLNPNSEYITKYFDYMNNFSNCKNWKTVSKMIFSI